MTSVRSFLSHTYSVIKSNTGCIFCIIVYCLTCYPCLKHIRYNHSTEYVDLYSILSGTLVVLLSILLPFLCRYFCNNKQQNLLFILLSASLCSFAATPFHLHVWTDLMLNILYTTGILSLTYTLFKKWSVLVWGLWLFVPICLNIASLRYQIVVDAHLLSEIIGASPQDIARFMTPTNILLCAAAPFLTIIFSYLLYSIIKRSGATNLHLPGLLVIILAFATSTASHRSLWVKVAYRVPEVRFMEIHQAMLLAQEMKSNIITAAEELPSSATPLPHIPTEKQCDECICLLHIGESVRSDHLSLFGYDKQTTPFLNSKKNLISYADCVSVAASTVPATFAILTDASTDIRELKFDTTLGAKCGGIMDIFSALDFKCFAFVNDEQRNETWGALYEKLLARTFASSADKILPIPNPSDTHSQIQQILGTLNTEEKKHIFCLINNSGSHLPFNGYDKQNPPFTPASCMAYGHHPEKDNNVANIVCNTYDCTIHYLDAYIADLLAGLQGKPYIYLYISDHGEFLGDRGIWVRNGDKQAFFNTPVCQVPFIIITSPEFAQQNPHFIQALERLKEHSTMSIGQEHIFHTLLGIFGIQSPYYVEKLDLTSDKVKPYTGPHPSRGGKTTDGKKWY